MAVIKITDDCLAPEEFIYFDYSGPNPWGVAKKINESARGFFHLGASDFYFDRVNWDITGDPVTFWALWRIRKDVSRYSRIWIYIRVQGEKSKTGNTGKFTMRMNAEVLTEFEGWSIVLKPFYYIYAYLFYNRVRRKFIERCRSMVLGFRNEIKKHYNVQVTEVPTAHGAFG